MTEKQKDFFDDVELKLKNLGSKMNHMFEEFVQRKGETKGRVEVPVDSYRLNDQLVFQFDLPGFARENLKIQVVDNQLIVKGRRERPAIEGKPAWNLQERVFGDFERTFSLPAYAVAEKIKAKFDLNVLMVTIPLDDYVIEEQEINID